jgi:hypothetical protein
VSGGGWGVGDLFGATRAALAAEPDATVLTLCGRNDKLRARLTEQLGGDPRLKLMGFTDRMGDVLAASDALIHSSAGLTVLEAIIRGCPVISYGFGYGHVRESNKALVRFGLAEVVRRENELGPAVARALEKRVEPDPRFARRPSTAALILGNERYVKPVPTWRLRAVRAATAGAALVVVGGWTFSASMSYSLVSHFTNIKPVTQVTTPRREVGVMVDVTSRQLQSLLAATKADGLHVSFAVANPSLGSADNVGDYGDEALPRLPDSGLVGWLHTRGTLHRLLHRLGWGHHFLYASSGPSLGQWLFAHGAGGRPVAGAVRMGGDDVVLHHFRAGDVVELNGGNLAATLIELGRLDQVLRTHHLESVPVSRLLRDSGVPV